MEGMLVIVGVVVFLGLVASGYAEAKEAQERDSTKPASPANDDGKFDPSSIFGADVGPASTYREVGGLGIYRKSE